MKKLTLFLNKCLLVSVFLLANFSLFGQDFSSSNHTNEIKVTEFYTLDVVETENDINLNDNELIPSAELLQKDSIQHLSLNLNLETIEKELNSFDYTYEKSKTTTASVFFTFKVKYYWC